MKIEAARPDPAGLASQWGVARKEEALVGSKEARNGLQPQGGDSQKAQADWGLHVG